MVKSFKTPKKYPQFRLNLNKTVNKINNTKSSMIGMRSKDVIKLDALPLDKTYPEETVLPEDGLYRYLYQPGKQH